ncbi:MAG TPA: lysylphosphatidylglycerol synthase transmembrane domain-containing protein [Puia sp.]|uniref:lysylphosphatidylglycerol synthase transmembrane domain-containing protein n=1 Tax=Puia sp. TaxID=2045100 RepID=UPI002BC0BAE4|nr:lysylphosphatidylglycerol synthase transmembrane domain-containing protein [Puia sp.]HVU94156.1 lysylphosphatidylglycerol synthase transmembrane domain-containing protein [Puia sp.]
MKTVKTRSWLLFFIFFVLVFVLAVYYFSEIKNEFRQLEKVNPYWLIAALCGQLMTYLFTAMIYRLLLTAYKMPRLPGRWELLKASIISLFFNQTVPSAGISGNTFLISFLARFDLSRTPAISLILEELLIFYSAMEAIIISLLAACLVVYKPFYSFKGVLTAGILVYLGFGLAVAFAGRKNMLSRLYDRFSRAGIVKKLFKSISKRMSENDILKNDIPLWPLIKNNLPTTIRAFFLQLAVVAADGLTLYVLFLGMGHPISPVVVLLTLICTKIISLLPFLPGSLVLYESSMSFFFARAGVAPGTAIVVTLVYRFLSFWAPMPVGTFLYRQWLKKAPADAG